MTADEIARLKEHARRVVDDSTFLDDVDVEQMAEGALALIAEVEWLRAELKIAQEDLQTERRNNGQFGVGA